MSKLNQLYQSIFENNTQHLNEEQIAEIAYAERTNATIPEAIWEHIESCQICANQYASMVEFLANAMNMEDILSFNITTEEYKRLLLKTTVPGQSDAWIEQWIRGISCYRFPKTFEQFRELITQILPNIVDEQKAVLLSKYQITQDFLKTQAKEIWKSRVFLDEAYKNNNLFLKLTILPKSIPTLAHADTVNTETEWVLFKRTIMFPLPLDLIANAQMEDGTSCKISLHIDGMLLKSVRLKATIGDKSLVLKEISAKDFQIDNVPITGLASLNFEIIEV